MWIILFVIIILLLLFSVGAYNSLVAYKIKVTNAFAQIDTQLKRRFDLIPNLVETVKGYAAHESDTLEKVISARNSFENASSTEDKIVASNSLSSNLKSIFALAENYPELKANENFLHLQNELVEAEDKISFTRQAYNKRVESYNTKIMTFPNNIIASMFKFTEEKFLEVNNDIKKENVKVSF